MPEAATPAGAEVSARPDSSANTPEPSIHDRIKASFAPEAPAQVAKTDATEAPDEGVEAEATETEQSDDLEVAKDEPEGLTAEQLSSISELADATGLELDKLFDLDVPTKIDGKEGTARLRDLIKSYQLEGHLNQKLMTHAEEKKAFEAESSRKIAEYQQRVGQLNEAVTLAQKILDGEYADVNWQELQRTDPLKFQAEYGAYKMRLDGIQHLAGLGAQEQQRTQAQQQAAQQAYLAEQGKLLDSKIPEWADKAKREKDVTEMVATLGEAYGITEQELKSVTDHRQILIARDAMAWRKLQKGKPAVVNKVKLAPKLLKPGTTQSKAAQDGLLLKTDRDRLRNSGKVQDAKHVLKRILFN